MEKYSLYCPIRKANPYRRLVKATHTSHIAPNLVNREFTAKGPRMVLLTDVSYIPYNGTFCYLSTIPDAYTRQILAYELSESLDVDFVLQAETIVHSDQGFHYTSLKFIQILKDSNLRQSMSRRGNCWDNAPQESFFGHMKDEIDLYGYTHFSQVKRIIDDWMDYYNTERYQWQLAKLAPDEYYRYITTGVYPLSIKEPRPAE